MSEGNGGSEILDTNAITNVLIEIGHTADGSYELRTKLNPFQVIVELERWKAIFIAKMPCPPKPNLVDRFVGLPPAGKVT